ncbi:type IV toxin-antitoxin system AbiEi family antitoxin [Knoellia koreensis]|uniref:AbiEi antitoxin C-terminal domain-containing protein n=1 Tax=Knoellia koreensis TaxID=2730921 RepID=A0A849H9F3_9MICO|nr:hypothetical protein [Knoellia sp. DB2414S]NNM46376.1 hypothetical protein [Knoellia sp. DB2414S]
MGGARPDVDWAMLRRYADRQADLVTRAQCLAAGLTDRVIGWRLETGRWSLVHEGVYLTKPGRADWISRARAALLYSGVGVPAIHAALAGRSALHLWGLERSEPQVVEVVVPETRRVAPVDGVRVRRVSRFASVIDPTGDPFRTTVVASVLDVATHGTPLDALSLVARAVQKEMVTGRQLRQEIVDRGGHRYSKLLKVALADVEEGAESGAEVLYIRDVERAHGLPRAVRQARAVGPDGNQRHDNRYDRYRLVLEVDGRLGHETWRDRVRDGRRDRSQLGQDRVTTRVFFADVAITPCQTAYDVAAILRSRGWTGTPRACRRPGCMIRTPDP